MNHLQVCKNEKGAASSWGVIVLVSLIAVLGASVYLLLPRPQAPEPEPIVVRMKIPPMPPPASAAPTEDEQTPAFEAASSPPLKQEGTAPPGPVGQSSRADDSSGGNGLSDRPETPSEQAPCEPVAAPLLSADDANPPSLPVAEPDKTPVDPKAEEHLPGDNVPKEKMATDGIAPTPVTGQPGKEKSSEPILISTQTDSDEGPANPAASPGSEENDVSPIGNAEKPNPFTIQAGVFRSKTNADKLASDLKSLGYSSFIHESQDKRQRPLYKVCFGRFGTKNRAGQTVAAFKEKEKKPAFVVRLESPM